ncbi:unnamed protein product [marine sediment metagenome]|uniref:Uncharacterized protein n=1 Tax=marine sediment metagenome TaxID=412755 RepID=X0Z0E1_9ZZZZ
MSKQQEKILRFVGGVITVAFAFGVTYGAMKVEMGETMDTVADHEKRIDKVEIHMERQTTNQEWIMDSLKRIEGRE